nr:MAG TPA: UDP-3-O-acyl-N-acetylglucosamine deacetylase [Caudoviricetes sp.]
MPAKWTADLLGEMHLIGLFRRILLPCRNSRRVAFRSGHRTNRRLKWRFLKRLCL